MECSICYEECKGRRTLVCGHTFCTGCIKEWYLKSEEPACPMCRGPLYFRGFYSSGWRQEKEGRMDDDEKFQELFDYIIDDHFTMYEEADVIPDDWDFKTLLDELQEAQITYNALKYIHYFDEDTIDYIMYDDYHPYAFRERYIWLDEPPKPWYTKYPMIF